MMQFLKPFRLLQEISPCSNHHIGYCCQLYRQIRSVLEQQFQFVPSRISYLFQMCRTRQQARHKIIQGQMGLINFNDLFQNRLTVGLFYSPLDPRQYRKIVARVAFQLIYRIQIDLREREFDQLLLKHRNPKNKIRKVAQPRSKLTLRT